MLARDCAAFVVLACGNTELATWALTSSEADLAVVDELARLQLAARRVGCSLRLYDVCDELTELLAFLGLAKAVTGVVAEVVGLPLEVSGLEVNGLQVGGEPEGLEQRGVEEIVVTDDSVA